ncbi:MAG TPA: hypothetical protein ENH82_06360 [bacterium]|nr:hypothetical protein [bacterium]
MNKKWLILDCNFLCHRLKHAMGGLSHDNAPTGVIYGFLKSIPMYQEMFDTPRIVFCWDSKTSKRNKLFPGYKANRPNRLEKMNDEEIIFETEFRYQMQMLRRKYLKIIGFQNVFCQKGYEADDLIASVCNNLSECVYRDEAIIITSDQDLYQCLRPNISIYNPNKRKRMTAQGFQKKYGIKPARWAMVKCIAGCSTDNVPGVKGVGEITAIKYLLGDLKASAKAHLSIIAPKGMKAICKNRRLVVLPFVGTRVFQLKKDELSADGWRSVIRSLGLKSIRDKVPMGIRRKRKKK